MIGSSLVSVKLASAALTREMVNSETARRLVPSALDSGKRWLLGKLRHHAYQKLASSDIGNSNDNEEELLRQQQQEAASAEYLVRHWLEALFAWFQVIVLWHEPRVSLCAISGLLSSFLLLTYFAPRFYATIMIALFLYNLSRFWFRHVWPEIRVPLGRERELEQRLDVDRWTYLHPQLMTLDELQLHFLAAFQQAHTHLNKLLLLRQRQPVAFAALLCACFTATALVGQRAAGLSLVFWTLAALMTAPGIYLHLLPQGAKRRLHHSLDGLKSIISNKSTSTTTTTTGDSVDSPDSEHAETTTTDDEELEEEEEEEEAGEGAETNLATSSSTQAQQQQQERQDNTQSTAPKEKDLIDLDDDYVLL